MNFDSVKKDLISMQGMRLSSIRPGAEIIIEEYSSQYIVVRGQTSKQYKIPLSTLNRIWDLLVERSYVRVEDVLQGSGSCRNQPETLLANLPYVEWTKLNGKKVISYVGRPTHSIGTLKMLDSYRAESLVLNEDDSNEKRPSVIIATKSFPDATAALGKIAGVQCKAIEQGVYYAEYKYNVLVFIDSVKHHIPEGSYPVLNLPPQPSYSAIVEIEDKRYGLVSSNGFSAAIPADSTSVSLALDKPDYQISMTQLVVDHSDTAPCTIRNTGHTAAALKEDNPITTVKAESIDASEIALPHSIQPMLRMVRRLRNREFAKAVMQIMREHDLLTPENVELLSDPLLCHRDFGCSVFHPYLKQLPKTPYKLEDYIKDSSGKHRYYANIYEINGCEYLFTLQLYKDNKGHSCNNRDTLIHWLETQLLSKR